VGNRATGDRIGAALSPGLLKVGAALVLTAPYTPMLFMGEEWAAGTPWQYFTDHSEPELAEAVRAGRRREFAAYGWAPDPVPVPGAGEVLLASAPEVARDAGVAHLPAESVAVFAAATDA